MSIGYLVTSTLVVICTAVALVPLRRPRTLGLLSFVLGQVVNELPHLVAAFLLASTALEVVEGNIDLGSPGGVALAGGLGLVLLAQAELARRSLAAPTVLTGALREGLGSAALETSRPRRHMLRWLLGFVPFRPRSVVRVPNRRYGPHRLHRLDIYHHRSRPQGARVLVYLHGGGYVSGGKHREARALLHRLAGRGWVCLSADYRLRPEADLVDHVTDAKRVIAWARQHGSAWGGDPRTLVISGRREHRREPRRSRGPAVRFGEGVLARPTSRSPARARGPCGGTGDHHVIAGGAHLVRSP